MHKVVNANWDNVKAGFHAVLEQRSGKFDQELVAVRKLCEHPHASHGEAIACGKGRWPEVS